MTHAEQSRTTTEPDTVTVEWCDEVIVEIREGTVRLTGLVDLDFVGYDGPERRIITRLVMLPDTGRAVERALRRGLTRVGH